MFIAVQATNALPLSTYNILMVNRGTQPLMSVSGTGTTTLFGDVYVGDASTDTLTIGGTVLGATAMVLEGGCVVLHCVEAHTPHLECPGHPVKCEPSSAYSLCPNTGLHQVAERARHVVFIFFFVLERSSRSTSFTRAQAIPK